MIRNKFVILPFLIFAWTIIFAHNIVPHHHHSENLFTECSYGHIHGEELLDVAEIHDCDHECTDNACHFEVEIFTRVSLDNIFIVNVENYFLNHISFVKLSNTNYYPEFVSKQIVKSNYLRGPPYTS